jgi:hypothetical protein
MDEVLVSPELSEYLGGPCEVVEAGGIVCIGPLLWLSRVILAAVIVSILPG